MSERWTREKVDDYSKRIFEQTATRTPVKEVLEVIRFLNAERDQLLADLQAARQERDEMVKNAADLHKVIDLNGMVHEAVMHVIRGEPVSDFEESFGDVFETITKVDESIELAEEIAKLQTAKECAEIAAQYIENGASYAIRRRFNI